MFMTLRLELSVKDDVRTLNPLSVVYSGLVSS